MQGTQCGAVICRAICHGVTAETVDASKECDRETTHGTVDDRSLVLFNGVQDPRSRLDWGTARVTRKEMSDGV